MTDDPWASYARNLVDAFKPRPPVEYAVKGFVKLPSLIIPYGSPGTLKTMLWLDQLICIAAGLPWLPPLNGKTCAAIPTVQYPVMWIDYDMGEDDLAERIEALARARNVDPAKIPFRYYSLPSPFLDARNRGQIALLAARIKEFGARVVGIDNLGIIKAGADENTDQMIPVMNNLRWLVQETRSSISVIHHQRKDKGNNARDGDKLRGHGSIEAAINLALLVSREEGSDTVTVRPTKMRGATVAALAALFTYEHRGDSNELETAKFFGLDDPEAGPIDRDIKIQLTGIKLNKSNLKSAVKAKFPKVGIHKIESRIDALADSGEIKRTKGERTEWIYSL